jgi:hypothetical protein
MTDRGRLCSCSRRKGRAAADGEPEPCRRTVIKDVYREPIEADDFGEALDDAGDVVERIAKFFSWRHIGLTEPRKVRRDNVKSVGEERNKVTKHDELKAQSDAG